MNIYSISGYDRNGIYRFFYHEDESEEKAKEWIKTMGFNYRSLKVKLACKGGYENF